MGQTVRLHHLDALRSFCMIYGIFVHALNLADFGALEAIAQVSKHFRMGTFFAVSAMLAVLVMPRMGPRTFLTKRLVAFLVPLSVGLLVLNPLTFVLIGRYFGLDTAGASPAASEALAVTSEMAPDSRLLHLWFLVSLTVYTLLAWPLWRLLGTVPAQAALGRLERSVPAGALPLVLAGATFAVALPIQTTEAIGLPAEKPYIVEATLRFLPYYLLGLVLGARPTLRQVATRPNLPLIGCALILLMGGAALGSLSGPADALLRLLVASVVTCAAILTLIGLFERLCRRPSAVVTVLTRSMYTVYLVHNLLIYAFAGVLAASGWGGPALYFAVVGATLVTGLALHEGVVRRYALLAFLLNGRLPDAWTRRDMAPARRAAARP